MRKCLGTVVLLASAAALAGSARAGVTFTFREPLSRTYEVETPAVGLSSASAAGPAGESSGPAWLQAVPVGGGQPVQFGSRVVLRTGLGTDLERLLTGSALQRSRQVAADVFILEAPDALVAATEAGRLAEVPGVEAIHPVRRRVVGLHGAYAPRPDDSRFTQAWHLDNRDPVSGAATGEDLNVRAAWPVATGEGILVAVADTGFEITHADLADNARNSYHYNFHSGVHDGRPTTNSKVHGTAVAGLIGAVANNSLGATGVAPGVELASWVVFDSLDYYLDEEESMDMFQYGLEAVDVQNHSWGNVGVEQLPLGVLEDLGIEAAVTEGRGGKGEVLVRAAGNDREAFNNTNDDGYAQDPRSVAVAAVRHNGRVCSYSTPGATVLVGAFSGDANVDLSGTLVTNYPGLFTTDRSGSLGYNRSSIGDAGDYLYGATAFSGTSGATPEISGLCALILSANPDLTYRDVQQVLVLSARQRDLADPDLQRNGAGLLVSHNVGFGVPDAGVAVNLAKHWHNRPPRTEVTVKATGLRVIHDDGLRLEVRGLRVPTDLESIPASPVDGLCPDTATASLKFVDVGLATSPIKDDLTGKAALIQRGDNYFVEKLAHVAEAGAAFAVIYNNTGDTERFVPNGADIHFTPIPAVFIGQSDGEALAAHLRQWFSTEGKLTLDTAGYSIEFGTPMICEHVRLRVKGSHARRGDLRITLVSPSGTRSVLQRLNNDTLSSLTEWDYYSVHHFFEPSVGTWQVEFSDQRPGVTGQINSVELTLFGVTIQDGDHDGLDDHWEQSALRSLTSRYTATDDPDGDGANNAREQIMGTDPLVAEPGSRVELAHWDDRLARLSWPAIDGVRYRIRAFDELGGIPAIDEEVIGIFPETTWFGPMGTGPRRFFSVEPFP
ncbi:MAG: S8 family serine peptidase [Verrucomicrobiales bacterium]|nr:S8 family serine peptidase [Verrucomicrobiales bacterium]